MVYFTLFIYCVWVHKDRSDTAACRLGWVFRTVYLVHVTILNKGFLIKQYDLSGTFLQIKGRTWQSYHVTRLSSHASCNVETNERGLRSLEFATFNNLILTNTLGPYKPSRKWTRQSPDRKHNNQIVYTLVKSAPDQELTFIGLGAFLEQTISINGS